MTRGRGRNVGASVRARLGNLARDQGVAFGYLLNRYAVERLLYRLSCSSHRATFERRRTPVPELPPVGLTTAFSADPDEHTQWTAFGKRTNLPVAPLPQVVEDVSRFVLPLLEAVHDGPELDVWPPGGPWRKR